MERRTSATYSSTATWLLIYYLLLFTGRDNELLWQGRPNALHWKSDRVSVGYPGISILEECGHVCGTALAVLMNPWTWKFPSDVIWGGGYSTKDKRIPKVFNAHFQISVPSHHPCSIMNPVHTDLHRDVIGCLISVVAAEQASCLTSISLKFCWGTWQDTNSARLCALSSICLRV